MRYRISDMGGATNGSETAYPMLGDVAKSDIVISLCTCLSDVANKP